MDHRPYLFFGWIPCLSGDLNFELSQCSLGVFDRIHLNGNYQDHEANTCRLLVASSVVDWQDDSNFDLSATKVKKNEAGLFRVTLIASSYDDETLRGDIFINYHPFEENIKSQKFHDSLALLANLKQRERVLKRLPYSAILNLRDCMASFSKKEARTQDKGLSAFYRVPFEVNSKGFATFDYEGVLDRSDELSTYDEKTKRQQQKSIARQAFYYLKYTLHKHKHHHENNDSLTTIHEMPLDKKSGHLLIKDLKHSIGTLLRDSGKYRHREISTVEGIYTYLRSLIASLKDDNLIEKKAAKLHIDYLDNTIQSSSIRAREVENEKLEGISFNSLRTNYLVLFLTGIAVIIGSVQHKVEISSCYYTYLIKILDSDLAITISGILALIVLSNRKWMLELGPGRNSMFQRFSDYLATNAKTNGNSLFNFFHIKLWRFCKNRAARSAWILEKDTLGLRVIGYLCMLLGVGVASWALLDLAMGPESIQGLSAIIGECLAPSK